MTKLRYRDVVVLEYGAGATPKILRASASTGEALVIVAGKKSTDNVKSAGNALQAIGNGIYKRVGSGASATR
jgi:MinD-like ATPase involved in chromosome partitioning or flagellar assembly